MTPTDDLCKLLDDYGVEYQSVGGVTTWRQPNGCDVEYEEAADGSDARLIVHKATPEMAIDVTLHETCHVILMDCFGNKPFNRTGLAGNDVTCGCSECGAPWGRLSIFRGNMLKHNFSACPICGRRVAGK